MQMKTRNCVIEKLETVSLPIPPTSENAFPKPAAAIVEIGKNVPR